MLIALFVVGIAVGSFLNVLATRYRDGGRIFSSDILRGRSRCDFCGQTLRWYELVPLFSFAAQGGRCRHCHHRLSWQYPIVELFSGLIFVVVPRFASPAPVWVLAALTLLLMSLIDLRLSIIPDQLNWFLALLGLAIVAGKGITSISVWENHLLGAGFGLVLFGGIIAVTRGRGMGLGDLKLAAALGFLFGWPEIVLLVMAAFAIGGVVSIVILALKLKSMKDALPFGPFLALAAVMVLFFGNYIINTYAGYFQIF